MQIPARVHYAALAMMDLAATTSRLQPVTLREITQRHGIPQPFLVQILQQLKTAGWVSSTRGSQGGYRMAVSAKSLTLLDIAEAVGYQDAGCSARPGLRESGLGDVLYLRQVASLAVFLTASESHVYFGSRPFHTAL